MRRTSMRRRQSAGSPLKWQRALPCCAPLVANNFSPASCSQRDTGSTLEYCKRDKNNKIFSATHGGGGKASHKTLV